MPINGTNRKGRAWLWLTRDRMLEYPGAFPILHRNTRRALIPRRFPYGLFYRIYGDTLVVVACMHAKQNPRRWQRRT
jgi:hypothetical protein